MATILLSPKLEPEFLALWHEFRDADAERTARSSDPRDHPSPRRDNVTDIGLVCYREVPQEFVDVLRYGSVH